MAFGRQRKELNIYYEDNEIIFVHNPAFVNAQSARGTAVDLESMIKNYLYTKNKTANPYVAVVHRLDNPVEGIMVYAKTKQAAGNLSSQIQKHEFKKTYLALVNANVKAKEFVRIENYLVKDNVKNMSFVVDKNHKDGKKSVLEYRALGSNGDGKTVLEIKLHTGRHHQIRVTMADIGYPLVGDVKYGNVEKDEVSNGKVSKDNVSLCAYKLEFTHPKRGKAMSFVCDIDEKYKIG